MSDATSQKQRHKENRLEQGRNVVHWPSLIVYIFIHLSPLTVLFFYTPTVMDWVICISMYFIRMFFITGGYHRYFAHRSYKTSRVFQFFLAFMAQTSVQKGVLWWAANHRVHHRYSDQPEDPHSLKWYGFLYSHVGWLFSPDFKPTRFKLIADFAKFKELKWLNKNHLVPPIVAGAIIFAIGGIMKNSVGVTDFINNGMTTMLIGFMLSTIILYHGTYSINSLMHLFGGQRYKSGDNSRNNLILALITLGEGWHNNHHFYMSSTRQGFFWWEIDITYYILKIFSWLGLVWDLKPVPKEVKYAHQQ